MTGSMRSVLLPEWWDPALVFHALYGREPYAVWLDAGADTVTGHSYLGAATSRSRLVSASVADGTVTVRWPADDERPATTQPGTIFEFLRADLGPGSPRGNRVDPADDGFRLGWVGWLGYELGAQTAGTPVDQSRYPDALLLDLDRVIDFDHAARTVTLHTGDAADDLRDWARSVQRTLRAAPEVPVTVAEPGAAAWWRHSGAAYATLIERCQAFIRAGDAYQLCLTNEIHVDVRPDPVATYQRLRLGSPSHHGGLLRFGEVSLLSASPEQFLHVSTSGAIHTKPIKGTRPRSSDADRDRELRRELAGNDKERAENLMIVDLMRNDLGRIADLGSVSVTSLLSVESYPHVHQLVSTIEARLRPGITGVDAVTACFPAGSMTGAPKISAIGILNRLEEGPRGVYAGAFGYFGRDGVVDLAIVIRSIMLDADGARIGTGGGITALSVPVEEIAETRIKAAALLAALGVDEGVQAAAPHAPPPRMGNLENGLARGA